MGKRESLKVSDNYTGSSAHMKICCEMLVASGVTHV